MSEKSFDFNEFIAGSIKSLQNPREYFSEMKTSGGFVEPLIKALIYGLVAGIIYYVWVLAGLNIAGVGPFGASAVGVMAIFGTLFASLIGLFIGGVIMLIFSAICSGSTDYEANVRVTASMMVLTPINAIFGFLIAVSPALSTIVGLLINAYGLWMIYNALTQSLKAKESSVKVLVIVLLVVVVFFTLLGLLVGAFFSAAESYHPNF